MSDDAPLAAGFAAVLEAALLAVFDAAAFVSSGFADAALADAAFVDVVFLVPVAFDADLLLFSAITPLPRVDVCLRGRTGSRGRQP